MQGRAYVGTGGWPYAPWREDVLSRRVAAAEALIAALV